MNTPTHKFKIPKIFEVADYDKDVSDELKKLFEKQVRAGKGIYLHGGTGTGKTHTAYAMAKKAQSLPLNVMFFNATSFLDQLKAEFKIGFAENEESLFDQAMNLKGILFIDDLGAEKCSEWVLERFTLLINHRWEEMLPIVFTSNYDLEILSARMGDRVSSRVFAMAEVVQLTGADRRLTQNS
jgi:DNA replication protein DnaC